MTARLTRLAEIALLALSIGLLAAASFRLDGALPALVTALGLAAVVRVVPALVARARR